MYFLVRCVHVLEKKQDSPVTVVRAICPQSSALLDYITNINYTHKERRSSANNSSNDLEVIEGEGSL